MTPEQLAKMQEGKQRARDAKAHAQLDEHAQWQERHTRALADHRAAHPNTTEEST